MPLGDAKDPVVSGVILMMEQADGDRAPELDLKLTAAGARAAARTAVRSAASMVGAADSVAPVDGAAHEVEVPDARHTAAEG
jgi:hypothetical protein